MSFLSLLSKPLAEYAARQTRFWSRNAILEEHRFAAELAKREIPVVAPLASAAGETLHEHLMEAVTGVGWDLTILPLLIGVAW